MGGQNSIQIINSGERVIVMTKRAKTWIVVGSIVGGLALAFGGFIIYANSPISPFVPRGGELIKFEAKKIGKTATLQEKTIKIKDHEFTYYNVECANDGGWVLRDKTSYIINTDIQFGFRYKSAGTKISAYNTGHEPRDMGEYSQEPSYHSYQVYFGFKITIDESLDMSSFPDGINLGIFEHWC